MEVDQAFARASCALRQCLAVEPQQLALGIALHGDDRVGDEVTSMPCSASSAIVESSRKGMLSLRISSTEISRPFGNVGLTTRISRCPTCAAAHAPRLAPPGRRARRRRNCRDPRYCCSRTRARQRPAGSCPAARCLLHRGSGLPGPCRHATPSCPPFAAPSDRSRDLSLILECISSSAAIAWIGRSSVSCVGSFRRQYSIPERKAHAVVRRAGISDSGWRGRQIIEVRKLRAISIVYELVFLFSMARWSTVPIALQRL